MGMFRKLLSIAVLLLVASVLSAQDAALLNKFNRDVSGSCVELSYAYSFRNSGVTVSGSGELTSQGLFWKLIGNGVEMYCDSSALWVVDPNLKEVVIEPAVTENDESYAVNPAILIVRMDKMFKLRDAVYTKDGKSVVYIMDPVEKGKFEYLNVELLKSDASIKGAVVALTDGNRIDIKVSSMKLIPLRTVEDFRPLKQFDASWIVTDLR